MPLIYNELFFDRHFFRLAPAGGQLALAGLHLDVIGLALLQLGSDVFCGGVLVDGLGSETLFQVLVCSVANFVAAHRRVFLPGDGDFFALSIGDFCRGDDGGLDGNFDILRLHIEVDRVSGDSQGNCSDIFRGRRLSR